MFNTDIDSTSELISIALATKRGAILRYSELAAKMHKQDNGEASTVFETLVNEEQESEQQLIEWASLEGMLIDADATQVSWEDPSVDTSYDVQASNPYRCTPYKAFAFAVHNEERAFLFYTYVAADSNDTEVCHHARVLARTALDHAASLRVLRRRAWRQQAQEISDSRIDPSVINSIPDFLTIIVFIEDYLADLFVLAGSDYPEIDSLAAGTQDFLAASEKLKHAGEPPGLRVIDALEKVVPWRDRMLSENRKARDALRRLCMDCDRSFTFYDSVVASTGNEEIMLMAQRQSSLSLERIAELRQITEKII